MSSESKVITAITLICVLLIGSCAYVVTEAHTEFSDCKGLKGVVERVWTGEPCGEV